MQESINSSLSWTQIALGLLATLLTGGGLHKLYNSWLERKKPAAEITVTEAQAVKTRAEARKINAEADAQFNAILERLNIRIEQMQLRVEQICAERDECRLKYDLQVIELRLRDTQIMRMKGLMDLKGIKLSDFDNPKEK